LEKKCGKRNARKEGIAGSKEGWNKEEKRQEKEMQQQHRRSRRRKK
jgi:hypothetical protein